MSKNDGSIFDIVIDLTQSGDAVRFQGDKDRESNLIQQEAKARVLSRIDAILAKVDGFKRELQDHSRTGYRPRSHDVITISGGRGSGKTTFILNLFEGLQNSEKKDNKTTGRPVEVLSIIDPTLIESKENILVTIISLIKRKVDNFTKQCSQTKSDKYNGFNEKLRKLAAGLQLLDTIGSKDAFDDNWADANWILEKGLKNAKSGTDFEALLHDFINISLEILKKDAFLLAFDDIDTSFERGWPVLETIRKYLTTPQMIVLLSGDLKLYARLVRRQQFENLGQMILQNDRPHANHHQDSERGAWRNDGIVKMVNELEDQYLLKIMKPENRVSLLTIDYYSKFLHEKYNLKIMVEKDKKESISNYIDEVLVRTMSLDKASEGVEVFRSAILSQPVRTAMQLLIATNETDRNDHQLTANEFIDRLIEIGAAALFHTDLSPEHLRFADGSRLLSLLAKWIDKNNLWNEGYRLVPNHHDDDINMVSMVFGGKLANMMAEKPDLTLLYILQISVLRELSIADWPGMKPTTQMIMRYLNLDYVEKPTTIARRLVVVVRSMRGENNLIQHPLLGTVPIAGVHLDRKIGLKNLYRLENNAGLKSDIKDDLNHIKSYWKIMSDSGAFNAEHANAQHRQVTVNTLISLRNGLLKNSWAASIPAIIIPDSSGRQTTFYSIWPLVGIIAELLAIDPQNDKAVEKILLRSEQVRSYALPEWVSSRAEDGGKASASQTDSRRSRTRSADLDGTSTSDDDNDAIDGDGDDNSVSTSEDVDGAVTVDGVGKLSKNSMVQALNEWLDYLNRDVRDRAYHPSVIARIGTRFIYTLQRGDVEIKSEDRYLGNLFHRQIVAFLNAILVEERLIRSLPEHDGNNKMDNSSLDLTNPTSSDYVFWRNIPKIESNNKKKKSGELPERIVNGVLNNEILRPQQFPLFFSFFSCPLLAIYVAPETKFHLGSSEVTWEFLNAMKDSWKEWRKNSDFDTEVNFTFGSRRSEKPQGEFANLNDLLNSVYTLQG